MNVRASYRYCKLRRHIKTFYNCLYVTFLINVYQTHLLFKITDSLSIDTQFNFLKRVIDSSLLLRSNLPRKKNVKNFPQLVYSLVCVNKVNNGIHGLIRLVLLETKGHAIALKIFEAKNHENIFFFLFFKLNNLSVKSANNRIHSLTQRMFVLLENKAIR